jgi:arylsulfatase A-like enzyme
LPTDLKELYGNSTRSPLEASPFGNELVEQLAERALSAEQLGMRDVTDLLTVSFSSNDKVGHDYGTFSPEEHDVTVQTDKILERLFLAIDKQVGLANTIVVLTADHGVAPSAAEDAANRMPGGRMAAETIRNAVQAALARQHGAGEWVQGSWDLSIYLNLDLIAQKGLDAAEVRKSAAAAAMRVAHVHRIYTRDQLMIGAVPGDPMSQRVMNGFNVRRSPDLAIILEPYWLLTNSVSTHGSTYSYDSHVPVIFMGGGVKAGRYHGTVAVNDIAPTLATMLDVEIPSGSAGRVLTEMLP